MNSQHPLYRKLNNMINRCHNENHEKYRFYGGRGISVCDLWRNERLAFVVWGLMNGWKPGLEIDRIDNDGDYGPKNCRFVTHKENVRNSRATKLSIYYILCIKRALYIKARTHQEIADEYGIHRSTVTRIGSGLRHAEVV